MHNQNLIHLAIFVAILSTTSSGCSFLTREDHSELIKQVEELGPNNIIIRSVRPPDSSDSKWGLTRHDWRLLESTIPTVDFCSVTREQETKVAHTTKPDDDLVDITLVGCTPEILKHDQLVVGQGRFLYPPDFDLKEMVCVVSKEIAENLFPLDDPIGKQLLLPREEITLTVVGVLEKRKPRPAVDDRLPARDFSREIYIPIIIFRQELEDDSDPEKSLDISQITVEVKDSADVIRTAQLVEATLKYQQKGREDFTMIVPLQMLEDARRKR